MKKETKIITKNWGQIDPNEIDDSIEVGGYQALEKFIHKMTPVLALEEIKLSGLCGRGGAGFPTGMKLESVQKEKSKEKYFICNLDESEPGTYKDRSIVDNDPHMLLEGVIIESLIVGARKAFVYVNGNYQRQIEILQRAVEQAQEKRILGEKILGSRYSLEVEIFAGAGAYICGEETALINSIEGNRGEPKSRPPFPTQVGLFGKPTAVNNAETVANIPWIISNGGKKYAAIGSKKSAGTKLFIVNGSVKNPDVFEAPLGTKLSDLIEKYAGGMQKGKNFWFAQVGGSSGRLVLEKDLVRKLEYDREAKVPLGSGAILVVDKTVDIHELLLSWMSFFHRESCGKCVPCREGTFRLWEIAKRLQDGQVSERDVAAIKDILWTLSNTTFCPLGKFAATAFGDAISNFQKEIYKLSR
ncbi:MAG: NADH-ubiquinone oxidoreductase-F iron-sulfur binding region domain-containing protein [Candidatus Moranbacteria bacterium]|nr:NADH-ubiquinone oxidoreductase-F iron-sulfur binding region domain-containing protein [Candidatus Moranbacteria bacterium]